MITRKQRSPRKQGMFGRLNNIVGTTLESTESVTYKLLGTADDGMGILHTNVKESLEEVREDLEETKFNIIENRLERLERRAEINNRIKELLASGNISQAEADELYKF